jgi:PAS domain S-box-containing protein
MPVSRKRFLTSILILSITAVLFLPLYTSFYLYPAFTRHLMGDAEGAAIKLANHIIHYLEEPEEGLDYEHMTVDVIEEVQEMVLDFGCEKVKLFAPSGKIIYSTDPDDIGQINTKDYFKPVITSGIPFTKIVTKNSTTAEGRTVSVDVVETYQPLKFDDRIIGASEVYFDITEHRKSVTALIRHSSVIIFSVTLFLLVAVLVTLFRLNKNMIAREEAEKELFMHRNQLEELVNDRTAELRKTNILLQEDIRKRQLAEAALRESEQKYRGLIETASDAIFVIDAETGKIIDVNRKGVELLGRPAAEIVGLHHLEIHPPDETEKYNRIFEELVEHTASPDMSFHVLHRDGSSIPVEISTSVMELGGRRIIQGIFRDISERMRLEEEIQKAQRLKSAGVLAGGIAHDFNNLLTAILGNVSLAKTLAESGSKVHERLAESEKATIRAKNLTQQLLTFAKGGAPITKTVDLSHTIVESAKFVLRGSNIKCDFSIDPDLLQVEADPGQINQVINNLVINAAQSMPDGGLCRIEAKNRQLRQKDPIPMPAGKYVEVTVHDEGFGISPENINRIFDPFFTTKPTGSGLGLSTAYSIVKKHGGLLTVASEIGKGATFHVFLPVSDKKTAVAAEEEAPAELQHGEGRILLMDDEEFVREIATHLLEHLGYTVTTAKEGKEALALYREALEKKTPFAAVIMDLTIPGGMGGKAAIRELKKIDPEAKTIVSSGYANDAILANYREYGFDGSVPKPYKVEELSSTLHQVLTKGAT